MARSDGTASAWVSEELSIRRRRLPHWQAGGSTYFVTFRLKGTLSRSGTPACGDARHTTGPLSIQERQTVRASALHWHPQRWKVHLLTVMPDHVHVLATPQQIAAEQWWSLSGILPSIKRHSARVINQGRGRRGALWDIESFDRVVRDQQEFDEKARYILNNAVKAGLCDDGWEYDGFWWEAADTE